MSDAEVSTPEPETEQDTADCDCPRLEPADWHNVESDWSDVGFLKAAITAVMGVPTGFEGARNRLIESALAMGLTVPDEPMVLLGDGQFRRPVLLEVEGEADDVVRPGGIAFSQLEQAPLGEMKRLTKALRDTAREKYGGNPDDIFLWYLTCRVCSRVRNFETLFVAHYRDTP